jgi:hypothetical protein
MIDLIIIPNRYLRHATVSPCTPNGQRWLAEFTLVDPDNCLTTSLDGAHDIEREAVAEGLHVETR